LKTEIPQASIVLHGEQKHQPTTLDLMAATLAAGITPETVGVMERLCALQERQEQKAAERDFAAAFAQLQSDMPQIVACKPVPDNSGNVRYSYAPYEEIMGKARSALNRNGFAITFDTDIADGRVIATCTLIHTGGHSRSNKFACRIGQGPPKASEAQGDGAATTYAKRFALCAALNIVIEHDSDARGEGGDTVTEEQAEKIRKLCSEVKADAGRFFAWVGAADFEQVPASKYSDAIAMLERRRNK
jgi:hypothetical protein